MTKPVRDYLDRCMKDTRFAAAYQDLEAEYQAERVRIRARLQQDALKEAKQEVEQYFARYPDLLRLLDLLEQLKQRQLWLPLISPAAMPTYADASYQISSEASYDAMTVTAEASH